MQAQLASYLIIDGLSWGSRRNSLYTLITITINQQ